VGLALKDAARNSPPEGAGRQEEDQEQRLEKDLYVIHAFKNNANGGKDNLF
jgi:hypothetical protein